MLHGCFWGWVFTNDSSCGCDTRWPLKHVHKIQGTACISSRASCSRVVEAVVSQVIFPHWLLSGQAHPAFTSKNGTEPDRTNRKNTLFPYQVRECFVWKSPAASGMIHKVQQRACIALAGKFPHFSLERAELYLELRVARKTSPSCLKIIGPFPGNCIAPAYGSTERNGTNGTERNANPGTPGTERQHPVFLTVSSSFRAVCSVVSNSLVSVEIL